MSGDRLAHYILFLVALFVLCGVLPSVEATARDLIAEKLKQASTETANEHIKSVNTKSTLNFNKHDQKRKQDVRAAKRQNKKEMRNARKRERRGEL